MASVYPLGPKKEKWFVFIVNYLDQITHTSVKVESDYILILHNSKMLIIFKWCVRITINKLKFSDLNFRLRWQIYNRKWLTKFQNVKNLWRKKSESSSTQSTVGFSSPLIVKKKKKTERILIIQACALEINFLIRRFFYLLSIFCNNRNYL